MFIKEPDTAIISLYDVLNKKRPQKYNPSLEFLNKKKSVVKIDKFTMKPSNGDHPYQ